MSIENLESILREHPFLRDFSDDHLGTIVGCAANRRYGPDEVLCREGEQAGEFFLIREGLVAIELRVPHRGGLRIDTVGEGDFLGWSWLVEPYLWRFDARTISPVRAIALDGRCLRAKCEQDHDFGYRLLRRFARLIDQRLQATRLQLLDVYGGGKEVPVRAHR